MRMDGMLGRWRKQPFHGVSLHGLTGYDGPSMLDGVLPENNLSDDPAAWSPALDEISEVEAAADRLISGNVNGALVFVRAGGSNVDLEVDPVPAVADDIQPSHVDSVINSVQSVLLIQLAEMQFTPSNLLALIRFISSIRAGWKLIDFASSVDSSLMSTVNSDAVCSDFMVASLVWHHFGLPLFISALHSYIFSPSAVDIAESTGVS